MEHDEVIDLTGLLALPGFIDLHVHGGGGATFDEGAASIATGLGVHRANGTTRSLVSLVTAAADHTVGQVVDQDEYLAADPVLGALRREFLDQ